MIPNPKRKRIIFKSKPPNLITSHQKYGFFQLKKALLPTPYHQSKPPILCPLILYPLLSQVLKIHGHVYPPLFRALHCTPHPKDLSEAFGRQAALVVSFKNRGNFPTNKRSLFVDDKEPL